MDLLPEECLDNIVSYVDVVSLTRLGLSSKRLRSSCFSPRYWTQVDFSTSHNNNFTSESIKKLSSFATELKILNIENCSNVNLESLVPFVFEFKNLELIKHDGQHRLLDETVAINRMLNNADKLIEMYSEDKDHSNEDHRSKFDNAVRQARALLWDALFIVVANKRGSSLPKEAYFQNIHHPQETLNLVMKKLRETENLLQQPLKLWHNTLAWKTAIECATFVKEPRTQKIYLACGVSGEIVLWDLDTRTVFKVFNYIDSLDQVTAKNAKRVRDFMDVFMFTHMDHVMILGGTSRGAVCWDYDTKQIIYEISLPYEEDSDSGYVSRHYAYSWAITNNQEGFIEVYNGAFLFDLGTGELGQLMRKPERSGGGNRQSVYSTKNSGSVLTAWKENADNLIVDITDLLTKQQTQILKLVPSSHEANYGEKTLDWHNGQLIAIQARRGIEIYKNQSDKNHQYELHSIIERPNHATHTQLKFLSDKLLLVDYDVINIDTGATEIQLESGSKGNHVIYSPELDILVHAHHIGVAAIYDFKTKQKIGPDPCVMPLCAMSKLDNETVLLHGNYSTLASFVNYHGRNYAKLSLKDCKVLETVDTPLQVLDVSSDGKYALAQDKNYPWKDRHNVTFVVFELDTKQVLFQRKFLEDFKTATWSISAVGQFMPRHPDQVLLSHPQCGFQIFDIKSGKLVHDCSTNPEYGGVGDHIKISLDERFVAFKSVKSNLGCNVVVDLIEKKAYDLNGHSNSSDAIAFNPTNSKQVLTAGCGISVFNLPNTKRAFFLTRYLDGLVETIRESEEVVCLRFSPDGKYLAAIDPPSRGPWGLEIANTLIRVYETTNFTQVSSFDTGGHARALYWLDNERAVVGMVNGELLTLQLVVKKYTKLFEYIVPSHRAKTDE